MPVEQRAAADADAGRVLHLRRQQMTLIEVRRRALGVEIQPVLRDGAAVERSRPVNAAAASSVAFASVYCAVAVSPLRSRRRSWICPACRVELPFDVRYTNPAGHAGHGLAAPTGYVFGRNSCIR